MVLNFLKEFREFKEDTKKLFNKIKEKEPKENKCLNGTKENTKARLMEMINVIQALRTDFHE